MREIKQSEVADAVAARKMAILEQCPDAAIAVSEFGDGDKGPLRDKEIVCACDGGAYSRGYYWPCSFWKHGEYNEGCPICKLIETEYYGED